MVELIIGMLLLSIIGLAIVRVITSQTRYFERQKTAVQARSISRGPLNRIVSDLRMVEAVGGILAASDSSVLVRVPYAMGVVCANVAGNTHVSLLPVDSAMYDSPGFSGYAWRPGNGVYRYVETGPPLIDFLGDINVCNIALVSTLLLNNAKVVRISPALVDTASVGTPIFLFRRIRYWFGPSPTIPGTRGLFRTVVETGATEELAAPFEAAAKFRFFVLSSRVPQAVPPNDLSTLRGVQFVLDGTSERIPTGAVTRQRAPFTTAVYFKNRPQ
ncbi:MAG TPA: hypothetical protein VM939_12410 [Gemmatimonadaceae bacterium]|nr:hypothetical protein [Gemmatimonadaceae bacterium]